MYTGDEIDSEGLLLLFIYLTKKTESHCKYYSKFDKADFCFFSLE